MTAQRNSAYQTTEIQTIPNAPTDFQFRNERSTYPDRSNSRRALARNLSQITIHQVMHIEQVAFVGVDFFVYTGMAAYSFRADCMQ